jgi:hypothetical protein
MAVEVPVCGFQLTAPGVSRTLINKFPHQGDRSPEMAPQTVRLWEQSENERLFTRVRSAVSTAAANLIAL